MGYFGIFCLLGNLSSEESPPVYRCPLWHHTLRLPLRAILRIFLYDARQLDLMLKRLLGPDVMNVLGVVAVSTATIVAVWKVRSNNIVLILC